MTLTDYAFVFGDLLETVSIQVCILDRTGGCIAFAYTVHLRKCLMTAEVTSTRKPWFHANFMAV